MVSPPTLNKNKLSTKNIVERLQPYGLTLVGPAVSSYAPLTVVCTAGHTFQLRLSWLRDCTICRKSGAKETTIQEIQKVTQAEGYTVIIEASAAKTHKYKLSGTCSAGHPYSSNYGRWLEGYRCRACAGSAKLSLSFVETKLASEGYTLGSGQKYAGNAKPLLFICPKGHHYHSAWAKWKKGVRCLVCSGHGPVTAEVAIQNIEKSGIFIYLSGNYKDKRSTFQVKCRLASHLTTVTYEGLVYDLRNCALCSATAFQSGGEKELATWVESLGHSVVTNDRRTLDGLELDILVPELKLAIEYCGLYSHATKYKNRDYHVQKYIKCQEQGIRLFTIFEDEWVHHKNGVTGFLGFFLDKKATKIAARNCEISVANYSEIMNFFEEHHLQGKPGTNTRQAWVLTHNDKVVAALSVAHHHRIRDQWVLNRYCVRPEYSVTGGFARLLAQAVSWLKGQGVDKLWTFSDRRYSQGGVYSRNGFIHDGVLRPDYHYSKGTMRFSKQSLKKTEFERGSGKTEWQLRQEQGYLMIYDCGKDRWVLDLK